jgi:hypothetical protein
LTLSGNVPHLDIEARMMEPLDNMHLDPLELPPIAPPEPEPEEWQDKESDPEPEMTPEGTDD